MARPKKNHCEYFSHDKDMRNHRKIKALRVKFGHTGYAAFVMILEFLTGADGNEFEYSEEEFELLAGDFGIDGTLIRQIVDYCHTLTVLTVNNGVVRSAGLDERLKVVYEKRVLRKENVKTQYRVNGKFHRNNGVTAPEMPQSKVKESKQQQYKHGGNGDGVLEAGKEIQLPIEQCLIAALKDSRWLKANDADETSLYRFNDSLERHGVYEKGALDYKRHYANWIKKFPSPGTEKKMVI